MTSAENQPATVKEEILPDRLAARAAQARGVLLQGVRASGAAHATPGPDAARSQDFLYDADGLPA